MDDNWSYHQVSRIGGSHGEVRKLSLWGRWEKPDGGESSKVLLAVQERRDRLVHGGTNRNWTLRLHTFIFKVMQRHRLVAMSHLRLWILYNISLLVLKHCKWGRRSITGNNRQRKLTSSLWRGSCQTVIRLRQQRNKGSSICWWQVLLLLLL